MSARTLVEKGFSEAKTKFIKSFNSQCSFTYLKPICLKILGYKNKYYIKTASSVIYGLHACQYYVKIKCIIIAKIFYCTH